MLTATLRPLLTAAIITYRLIPVKSDFPHVAPIPASNHVKSP